VGLDGDIGCIINGAGLAMASMDMIQLAGGEPANFLDIGGGASPERVVPGLPHGADRPNVSVILVNIFAGINRCDWIAKGVVQAYKEVGLDDPVVVRLSGTNVEEGARSSPKAACRSSPPTRWPRPPRPPSNARPQTVAAE
jgi:malate-CoA ligase subunit beta